MLIGNHLLSLFLLQNDTQINIYSIKRHSQNSNVFLFFVFCAVLWFFRFETTIVFRICVIVRESFFCSFWILFANGGGILFLVYIFYIDIYGQESYVKPMFHICVDAGVSMPNIWMRIRSILKRWRFKFIQWNVNMVFFCYFMNLLWTFGSSHSIFCRRLLNNEKHQK